MSADWRLCVLLDHGPGVVGEVLGQIVQGASSGKFLADLRSRRVARITPGTTMPRQRPIAGIEMDDHVTVIFILPRLERELPGMWLKCLHVTIVGQRVDSGEGANVPEVSDLSDDR